MSDKKLFIFENYFKTNNYKLREVGFHLNVSNVGLSLETVINIPAFNIAHNMKFLYYPNKMSLIHSELRTNQYLLIKSSGEFQYDPSAFSIELESERYQFMNGKLKIEKEFSESSLNDFCIMVGVGNPNARSRKILHANSAAYEGEKTALFKGIDHGAFSLIWKPSVNYYNFSFQLDAPIMKTIRGLALAGDSGLIFGGIFNE